MQLHIRAKNIHSSARLRGFIARTLDTALAYAGRNVRAAWVWLEDVNGPKGGVDKRCRIRAEGFKGGTVTASAAGQGLGEAVDNAAGKLLRALSRRTDKARSGRRYDALARGGGFA